ncbi:MAG: hypothetical protein ACI4JC_02700 [Faecalibacterium sp.]
MLILNQKFDFSALNADDVARMESAQARLNTLAEEEKARMQAQPGSLAHQLRGQCRLIMDFLDEVLGEGASARLGLNGSDLGRCQEVMQAFTDAVRTEFDARLSPAPNRQQRRALARAKPAAAPAVRVLPEEAAAPTPAPTAAERLDALLDDPAARRLLIQLAGRMAEGIHD